MADVHPRSRRAAPVAFQAVVAAVVAVVTACAEDPRVARRQSALDVAGAWTERRDDGVTGAAVEIAMEADPNDVVVTITNRVLVADEAAAIAGVIDVDRRAALAATLVLGAGRDAVREETDGGENVSFDLGATTTVQVTSSLEPVTPSSSTSRDAAIGWALRLDGDGSELQGRLEVFVRETQARAGDVDGFGLVTTGVASIPLRLGPTVP